MTMTETLDTLRRRVRAEMDAQLPEHLEHLTCDAAQLRALQRERVRALLAHAAERSPFHARRLDGVAIDRLEPDDLTALPVMTKAEMMANFDDVVTDRRLTLAAVEAHLAASAQTPSLLLDEYVCLASGGSSGHRGVFVQTLAEHVSFSASVVRRAVARVRSLFDEPPELVIAVVGAASPVHATGFGAATTGGPVTAVSVPATLAMAEIVERLNEVAAPVLMGYPSMLVRLAREQQAGRLHLAPFAITATSEAMTADDRAAITAAFGVPVVDQFASTEGLVGHSEPGETVLTFAGDLCLVELVDADDQPVPIGEPSAKVLVTNLHNLTQPLIRYELTDRFVRHEDAADHGYLRATVEGRSDQVFSYGELQLHPIVVRSALVKTPAVVEYQVQQTACGIDIDVVAAGTVDVRALVAALEAGMRDAGLPDPRARVQLVDAIARHPQTGKVRRFVPLAEE